MRPPSLCVASVCLALGFTLAGCSKSSGGGGGGGGGPIQITGNERIGWDQPAADASELSAYKYHIWVDGVGSEIADVSCSSSAGSAGFPCTGALPHMSNGTHSLEVSAFVAASPSLESARSPVLQVTVTAQAVAFQPARTATAPNLVSAVDGVQLQSEIVADGLNDVTDLAFVPDGRILIAERSGRIRIVSGGQLQPEPTVALVDVIAANGSGLLSIAVDPAFAKTSFVYAVYTAASGMRLVRFIESHGRLVNGAVLMDDLPHRIAHPAVSLRFGPDGKLYLALDDSGDPSRAADLGSYSGKVLRLNADGSTPSDQAGGTPVFLLNVGAPRGLTWGPDGAILWVADAGDGGTALLQGAASSSRDRRAATLVRYNLPSGVEPAGLATIVGGPGKPFQASLLVATGEQREILRLKLDASSPTTVVATERLPADLNGPLRAIAVSSDGTLYVSSPETIVGLRPAPVGPSAAPVLHIPG